MKEYYKKSIKIGYENNMNKDNIHPDCHGSMNNMGIYYFEKKEYKDALFYFQMAEKSGSIDALFNLGLYYEIIDPDNAKMKEYYEKSSNLGCRAATQALYHFYKNNEKNDSKTKEYEKKMDKKYNKKELYVLSSYFL